MKIYKLTRSVDDTIKLLQAVILLLQASQFEEAGAVLDVLSENPIVTVQGS